MTRETTAYVDRWAWAALAAPVLALVLVLVASARAHGVWQGNFTLGEDEEGESPPIVLPVSRTGGVRIEARAHLPTNHWAAYQVTVLDAAGERLLEVVKEAWAESGVWYEDGESGTWDEDDTRLLWDLRARAPESVTILVSVLEIGTADGSSVADPALSVPIAVSVRAGVADGRWLALAVGVSLAFAVLAYYLAGHGGRPVIVESNADSDVKGRAVMGGPGRLVRVAITGRVDETAPPAMAVKVTVRDEMGKAVYRSTHAALVHFRTDDGAIEDGRFSLHLCFELPRTASWGIVVAALPDNPMEHLKLLVRDRATTRTEVNIEALSAQEDDA